MSEEKKVTESEYLEMHLGSEFYKIKEYLPYIISAMQECSSARIIEYCTEDIGTPTECDVEGCENEPCCGGTCWSETGYWSVCHKHSQEHREGKPQPKMKDEAIAKEATRDKVTGYLPIPNQK